MPDDVVLPSINKFAHDEFSTPVTTSPLEIMGMKPMINIPSARPDPPKARSSTQQSSQYNVSSTTGSMSATPAQRLLPQHSQRPEIHEGHSCHGCGMNPIIGGRYTCLEISCPSYDLCSGCKGDNIHFDGAHTMLMIPSPKDAVLLETHVEPDPDNEVALGLRVYSKEECPSTIRGQLRHGQVIRWK